jgi:hypothetical protein
MDANAQTSITPVCDMGETCDMSQDYPPSPSSTCPEKLIITECAACGNSDPYYIRTRCWLLLLRSRLLLFCCCCFILLLVAAAPLVIIINVIILFHVVVQLLVIKGKMKKNEGESLMI